MAYDHPFKDWHEDCDIGHLMWALERRGQAAFDSQTGSHINDLEREMTEDRARLQELLAAYNSKKAE